jgi:hypothetical protein
MRVCGADALLNMRFLLPGKLLISTSYIRAVGRVCVCIKVNPSLYLTLTRSSFSAVYSVIAVQSARQFDVAKSPGH